MASLFSLLSLDLGGQGHFVQVLVHGLLEIGVGPGKGLTWDYEVLGRRGQPVLLRDHQLERVDFF